MLEYVLASTSGNGRSSVQTVTCLQITGSIAPSRFRGCLLELRELGREDDGMLRGLRRTLLNMIRGDRKEWSYLPYRVQMRLRGIDISWVSLEELGLSEATSVWHGASGGPYLDNVLRTLEIFPSDVALDIGCGKGAAMLTMLHYPFRRVDGVDISPKLLEIARRNLSICKAPNSSLFCSNAAEFRNLDDYTWFYMYNPFPAVILKQVLGNITDSLRRAERRVAIIYNNPVHGFLIEEAGFRKVAEFRQDVNPCFVYGLGAPGALKCPGTKAHESPFVRLTSGQKLAG
jgi:SAM-dependent methyltransferase